VRHAEGMAGWSRTAEFLALVEFGERFSTRRGVDVSFPAGVAGIWEDDGPSAHGALVPLGELRIAHAAFLADDSASWLVPFLDEWEAGADAEDVRDRAAAAYEARHGRPPARRESAIPDSFG
jgi:hypothetical protein